MWLVFDARDLLEFLKKFSLPLVEFAGSLHAHLDEKVTLTMPIEHRDSFVAKSERTARLGSLGNFQFVIAVQRWHGEFSSQSGLGKRNRNDAMKIGTFTRKERMLFDM